VQPAALDCRNLAEFLGRGALTVSVLTPAEHVPVRGADQRVPATCGEHVNRGEPRWHVALTVLIPAPTRDCAAFAQCGGVLLPGGASADVEIVIDTKSDVVTALSKAVLGRGKERYVYRIESGVVRKTPVQVGISGFSLTEIISGLGEGDELALPSDKADLKDGLAVTPKRA
jgi:hypothetical protein